MPTASSNNSILSSYSEDRTRLDETGRGENGRVGESTLFGVTWLPTESLAAYWLRCLPAESRLMDFRFAGLCLDLDPSNTHIKWSSKCADLGQLSRDSAILPMKDAEHVQPTSPFWAAQTHFYFKTVIADKEYTSPGSSILQLHKRLSRI